MTPGEKLIYLHVPQIVSGIWNTVFQPKVGSFILYPPGPNVEVSLRKTLNPTAFVYVLYYN